MPQAILDGMELGLKSAEPWLVLNGVVYAWNHYIHFINGQHVVAVESVFKAVTDKLFLMDKLAVDPVSSDSPNNSISFAFWHCDAMYFVI